MTTEDTKEILVNIVQPSKETSSKHDNSISGSFMEDKENEDDGLNTSEQLELQTYKKKYNHIDITKIKSNEEICKE